MPGTWFSGGTVYGTRCSVGSGWMSHADTAAAAPPVAPRTVRNRLRSICRASVVTHGAVARDVALHVAVDAPAHLERGDLVHLRHGAHVAVAGGAALGAQDLDMALVREAHEARECVHARPHGWPLVDPRLSAIQSARWRMYRSVLGHGLCRSTRVGQPCRERTTRRNSWNGTCGRRNVAPARKGTQGLAWSGAACCAPATGHSGRASN